MTDIIETKGYTNILTLEVLKEYLGMIVSLFLAIIGLIEAVCR